MAKNRSGTKHRLEDVSPTIPVRVERPWIVPIFFALLTVFYFFEFVSTDKVIFGNDIGRDFHRGKESFTEKLKTFGPGAWDRQLGGFPSSEEIRKDFFPTSPLELFTTYQRHIGWRYMLTVFFAGFGMYHYLRNVNIGFWPSLWAGVAFMSAPTFMTFTFAGHYAKMAVIALLPWMLLCLHRGMIHGKLVHFLWLSVLIGMGAYSPHVQMLQYALIAVGLYFLFYIYQLFKHQHSRAVLLSRSWLFALAVILGLGVGSEGLFPPYLHAKDESKRAEKAESETHEDDLALARSWSLHPEEIGSLFVPEFGGFYNPHANNNSYWGRNPGKYNSEYFGIVVVLLAIPILSAFRRDPQVALMSGLFFLALAFTLGGHTPVHWVAAHVLPGGKVLRSVGMAAFLFAFPATVLAAIGLQRMVTSDIIDQKLQKRLLIAGACLIVMGVVITAVPGRVLEIWVAVMYPEITSTKRQIMMSGVPQLAKGGLYAVLVCAAAIAIVLATMRKKVSVVLCCLSLIAITVADTWRVNRLFIVYEDPDRWPDKRLENPRTRSFLNQHEGSFRVFPIPSFQLLRTPGYHLDGTDVVTGFNNYTIRRYDRLVREFDPVLSLFSARFNGQEIPYSDDELLASIRPLLNLVNARYVITPKTLALQSEHFPELFSQENLRVYSNDQALPWFYLAPSFQLATNEDEALRLLVEGRVDPYASPVLEHSPNGDLIQDVNKADLSGDRVELLERSTDGSRIVLSTVSSESRLLILSENFYPNWRAYLDGNEVPIFRANYVWKGVYLPAGSHRVEFLYRSPTVRLARTATLISIASLVVLGLVAHRRQSHKAGEDVV